MAKVSVIVSVYNTESLLEACMKSLICQTLQDIEIICIDDGSTDATQDILMRYQESDRRVKVICNDGNMGQAVSRNIGLSVAQGEYIQFVDSDDYIESNALEKLYVLSESYGAEMCYLGMNLHPEEGMDHTRLQPGVLGIYPGVYKGKELIQLFTEKKEFFLYLCSVFYQNAFIKKHCLYFNNLSIGEGGDFILRALCRAEKVLVCSEQCYHYRVHGNSITHGQNAKVELMEGQLVQYINVLKYFSHNEDASGLAFFLNEQYRKIAGGIQNLSENEAAEIEGRLETGFAKHVFHMLAQNENQYGIVFGEQVLEKAKEKRVVIYGAGYASKEVLGLLQKHGIEIVGFAVTKRKKEATCMYGHHIYEIQELLPYKNKMLVLVASNKIYNQEIQVTLDRYGFTDYVFLNVEI